MKHEYVGDIGDFGKYALLKALAADDLPLGVVWYLNLSSESNKDGLFTDYSHLRSCDPVLHDRLMHIVQSGKRSLDSIEVASVLPDRTSFYRESLPIPDKPCFTDTTRRCGTAHRQAWQQEAVRTLSDAQMVFLDPDNGLASTKLKVYSRRSAKYAFKHEVTDWINAGKSVVLYQHQQRRALQEHAEAQLKELQKADCSGWALTFHRKAVRIYFVLPASEGHKAILWERTKAFLDTEWGRNNHFRLSKIPD